MTPADPYDMGSGRVDLTHAGDPGLTFDVSGRSVRRRRSATCKT